MNLPRNIRPTEQMLGAALIGRTIKRVRLIDSDDGRLDLALAIDFTDGQTLNLTAAGGYDDYWLEAFSDAS